MQPNPRPKMHMVPQTQFNDAPQALINTILKKSKITKNTPSPPAESKNVKNNAPSSSLGRELPFLTCPIANRATHCSANNLRIYCHNVQCLRGEEKLEWITRCNEGRKIDAYIIQETRLEGDS